MESGARAAGLARLRLAGVDVVTPDPHRPLEEVGGVVLEVNATPGLQHHYKVRDPEQATPVAATLLERILQERFSQLGQAEAVRSTATPAEMPAGDCLALGATAPETVGSKATMLPAAVGS